LLVVPQNRKELLAITELCEAGKVHPVIDRRFSFNEIPEAMRYVSDGRAKGKVVITVA
jgi:NADPH:quinone reductase-like Zn-dependent oxidoreductase